MKLAEPLFLSIQWEGMHTWLPSIFVRFFGCNKCCKWCDSLYAVNNPESIIDTTPEQVVKEIKKISLNTHCRNIVFTWWEPTLFSDDIAKIQELLWNEYTYEIETNWSLPIENVFEQINISPKLSNSGNKPYPLRALEDRIFWRTEWSGICFKFVAKDNWDFPENSEMCFQEFPCHQLGPQDLP